MEFVKVKGEEEERYEDPILEGQMEIRKLIFGYTDTMALKCAVELRIPDIIHSNGAPMSLSQIASHIGSPTSTPDLSCLLSLMRFLVRKKILMATSFGGPSRETLYGLTHISRWLLHDAEMTLVPLLMMRTHPWILDPWQHLSTAIKEDKNAFEKTHGSSLWEMASNDSEFNNLFNNGLACASKALVQAILSVYKDGFQGIETLVDVGGGNGYLVAEIVKANWPRIKGINFELQHVVENAPLYRGVTHVVGDMFESIPNADAIIMKLVLHNWNDEDCKKILRNCRQAISKKLILVEVSLQPDDRGLSNDMALSLDLLMAVLFSGGKGRTQLEWTKLLEESGFCRLNFIDTPVAISIIEAYPS